MFPKRQSADPPNIAGNQFPENDDHSESLDVLEKEKFKIHFTLSLKKA